MSPVLASRISSVRSGWRFALTFSLLSVISTLLFAYIPESLHALWIELTISLARGIGSLSGLETTGNADILSVNGFEMQIITQCTAIHYLLIISAAILASHWHTPAYRLAGIMASVPLLIVANAVRLLATGLAGAVSMKLFNFVHEYLWVTLFILLTWGVWIAWDRGFDQVVSKRRLPVLVLFCTLFHLILTYLDGSVGRLVTGLANMVPVPFNFVEPLTFKWDSGLVLTVTGNGTFTFSLTGEVLLLAVYSGVVATGIALKEKIQVSRVIMAGLLLLVLCVLVVVINGVIVMSRGADEAQLFLWLSPAIMASVLIVLWRGGYMPKHDDGAGGSAGQQKRSEQI